MAAAAAKASAHDPAGLSAQSLFYPAAALYAALVLPASALWMPAWHAHEMLFGFALAVVAGNQLGLATGRRIALLFMLWVFARIVFLLWPAGSTAALANGAFALALAVQAAPRLARSAKKWRNQALPAVLVGLCIAAAAFHIRAAVMLFATLMLFMGGRILAPAVAGQLQRQGVRLGPRVQPRLEAALLGVMALAVGAAVFPEGKAVLSFSCLAAAALAGLRMLRWRLWALRGRPDLLCLAAGYGWLVAGLAAFGASVVLGQHEAAAMHLITVGALGTLTFNVMAMTWLLRKRREPARCAPIWWGTALLAAATLLRLAGALEPKPWLMVAALCWSAAYGVLLALFFRTPRAG